MALIAPLHTGGPASYPGFPPRGGMTFGEVVSSYNMFGSCAAKRHNYMIHHQETHLPDDRCTIQEKVALIKDPSMSWSNSSRGRLTPRWSATRSRTPSPWMPRRPRSLPGTPRSSTPGLRPSDSRDRYSRDPMDFGGENYFGDHIAGGVTYDSKLDGLFQRGESGRYSASALDTFAVDHAAADTFAIGIDGGRGRGVTSSLPAAAPLVSALVSGGARASAGGIGDSPSPHDLPSRHSGLSCTAAGARPSASLGEGVGAIGAGPVPALRTPHLQAKGLGSDRSASRSAGLGGSSVGYLGCASEPLGRVPTQIDARAASFVRLNSFLLRTHVTSLVSALAEDGWLEAWEKERLCSQAREDSPAWSQAFFRTYMRFMDTEDVPTFVASLRSQIV